MNVTDGSPDLCPRCMSPLNGHPYCPKCQFDPRAYTPARHHLPPLTILDGKYLVGCALGEGGFGITYVGWDLQLHTMVAIKEYFPTGIVYRDNGSSNAVSVFAGSGEEYFFHDRDRFLEEARMLARFDGNPGVVNVKNYFKENGTAYIVMEYVQGVNLAVLAEQNDGRLPFGQVMKLLALPMKTLGEMHRQNTFHRDISPENLMVTSDSLVKLIDFGSAKTNAEDKSRFLKVRQGFSALEMYADEGREGAYSDIYSLCATIYRTVTGVTPPPAAERARKDELVPPIQAGAAGMTPAQERALLKGLAVQPQDRYQRVEDLSAALAGDGREAGSRRRRPRRALWIAAIAALLAVLGLVLFLKGRSARFALREEMFADAPEIWACYRENGVYPYSTRAYITADGLYFTSGEADNLNWTFNTWKREPMSREALEQIADCLEASGIPIHQIILQNCRFESLEPLVRPWASELELDFDCCTLPDDWSVLGGLADQLDALHVGGEYPCDDLSWLSSLTQLRWLALGGEGIDLESISGLDWLSGASIGGAGIEDLTPFARMKNLTELCLPGNAVRDLSPLAGMSQLKSLEFPGNQVEDLSPLAGLENLRLVNVTDNRVTDFSPIERDGIEIVGRDEQRP